jgi:outer membrane autotransporter protein
LGTFQTVINSGTISGGAGGLAGRRYAPSTIAGTNGAGGAGIVGADLTIINSGTINGGYSGDGLVRASAIEFSGLTNSLELRKGSNIGGNVVGSNAAGASNTLALGGTDNDSFDTSQIGSAAQYRNFTDFQKTGTSTYTLTGTSTSVTPWSVLGGTLAISADNNLGAAGGALTLDGGTLQGTATLTTARAVTLGAAGGTVNTDASTTTTMSGVITGAGGLTKTGAGALSVSGANTYAGTTHVGAGTLQADALNTLSASSAHTVDSGATLALSHDQTIGSLAGAGAVNLGSASLTTGGDATSTAFSGVMSGTGELVKTGAGTLTLSGANTYSGATHVGAGMLQADALNTLSASSAHTVDSGATLALSHDQTIGSLAGAGAVSLDSANLTTGGDATSTAFSGVMSGTGELVKTGAGTLTLSGANTYSGGSTVQGGTLAISADNNLGAPGGALALDGGTLQGTATLTTARAVTLGAAGGTVNTDASTTTTMSGVITGAGGLTKTGAGALSVTGVNTYAGATRVGAGTLQADALNTLSASSAHTVDSGATLALSHDQTIGSLAGAGAVNLDSANLTTGGDATSTTFSGVMSGTGELIKTGAGTLTLNGANTYSGATHVDAGTLQADALNTLSASSAHTVDNGATLALSHDQTIGSLAGAGTVNLDSANLTTGGDATSTTFSGVMSGSGELIKTGAGTLTLSGANTYSGGSTLAQGRIDVAHNSALGTGSLALDQNATLGFAADDLNLANDITLTGVTGAVIDTGSHDETLSGVISGAGILSKVGSGSLNLSGANTYSGATQVNEGTLRAAAPHTFSAASAHNVANGATLDTGGFDQRVAALTNNGTVSLAGSATGSTLTVTGPYGGQNGVLRLGTALSDSTGVSDRLELNGPGAVASGSTQLQIVNLQGLGALTLGDGITVVSAVNGATTTAQTTKDAFSLAGGHVVAGAYEYNLYAADASGAGENWYLRSTLTTVPVTPVPPTQPSTPAVHIPTYRTEVPLLAALPEQLRQGNLAMLGNLHQRIGSNAVRGEPTAQGWGRVLGTKLKIGQSGTVSPSSDGNLEGFQIGSDLYADDDWHAGLYVGDLKGNMDVKGFARGIDNLSVGHNDLHSQYLGGYATWTGATGLYVDTVLQRGRHDDDAHSQGGKVSGKGDSWLASVEMGQPFALNSAWSVEPQVQLVQQHLDLDDAHIGSTRVRQDVDQGWMARLGARLEGDYATGAGRVQPYGRVNLYRAANGNDVTRFENAAASTAISSSTGYTSRELAGGATLKLNDRTDVYAEIGKQWAAGGDSDVSSAVQGSMGVRVKW